MEEMTVKERIWNIDFETLSKDDFDFLVKRALNANKLFTRTAITKRGKVLEAMDEAIRFMQNERATEYWFMDGIPDGSNYEEYFECRASCHEDYIDLVKFFAEIVEKYAEEDF